MMRLFNEQSVEDIADEVREQQGVTDTYKIAELKSAVHNAIQKYKQNNPTNTVNNGVLTNSYDVPILNYKLYGNSTQETRSGYNLYNKYGDLAYPPNSYTNRTTLQNDGTLKTTANFSADASKGFRLALKQNTTYTIKGKLKSSNGDLEVKAYVRAMGRTSNWGPIMQLPIYETGDFSFTFNSGANTDWFLSLNANGTVGMSFEAIYDDIMVYEGTEDKSYEPYGVMPSPDYPSEIKSVGDKTKNLFDKKATPDYTSGTYGFVKIFNNENTLALLSITDKDTSVDLNGIYFGWTKIGTAATGGFKWLVDHGDIITNFRDNSKDDFNLSYFSFYPNTAATWDKINQRFNIQIELGSTATAYEPYGYKLPIKVSGKNKFNVANVNNMAFSSSPLGDKIVIDSSYRGFVYKLHGELSIRISRKNTTDFNRFRIGFTDVLPEAEVIIHDENWATTFVEATSLTEKIVTVPNKAKYLILYMSNANQTIASSSEIQIQDANILDDTYELYHEPVIKNIYLDRPLYELPNGKSDYLDFSTGKRYNLVGRVLLDGSENWTDYSESYSGYYTAYNTDKPIGLTSYFVPNNSIMSNYFESGNPRNEVKQLIFGTKYISGIKIYENKISSSAQLKSWLSTHNTEIVYELATPTEENIELPPLNAFNGTTIIELDTEIQPSKIEANYITKVGA